MWLIDLEAPPARLRGLLARWSVEVRAGLYVGSTSVRVRDEIWRRVCGDLGDGNAVLVCDAPTHQGFEARTAGKNRREVENVDGLCLARFKPTVAQRVPWDDADLLDVDPRYLEEP